MVAILDLPIETQTFILFEVSIYYIPRLKLVCRTWYEIIRRTGFRSNYPLYIDLGNCPGPAIKYDLHVSGHRLGALTVHISAAERVTRRRPFDGCSWVRSGESWIKSRSVPRMNLFLREVSHDIRFVVDTAPKCPDCGKFKNEADNVGIYLKGSVLQFPSAFNSCNADPSVIPELKVYPQGISTIPSTQLDTPELSYYTHKYLPLFCPDEKLHRLCLRFEVQLDPRFRRENFNRVLQELLDVPIPGKGPKTFRRGPDCVTVGDFFDTIDRWMCLNRINVPCFDCILEKLRVAEFRKHWGFAGIPIQRDLKSFGRLKYTSVTFNISFLS